MMRRSPLVAAFVSPLAIARLSARAWLRLAAYVVAASAVLGAVAWAAGRGRIRELALAYVFPDSWRGAARFVIDRFFEAQQRAVSDNVVLSGSLALVTVLLFWLKEALSVQFERDARLVPAPMRELPLSVQAWEEIKLFALFVAVQLAVFWIGYHPGRARDIASVALSYAWLFFMFAVDFTSPVLQRHGGHYSRILKVLARHPVATLGFGALFAAPSLVASRLWPHDLWMIFGANVIGIAWAAVAGTWFGAHLYDEFERTARAGIAVRALAWAMVVGALAFNGYRTGALVLSVHHKSQLLKLDYDVALSSFGIDLPPLRSVLSREVEMGVHLDVRIHNPTPFDVAIERNRLVLAHDGAPVATGRLAPMSVPAGATVEQRVALSVAIAPGALRRGWALADVDRWSATLYVEVAPGFEFPIYLIE
ncbi:MAG: hypothetical protein D6689_01645 [Deltaproteobacteria bacterium]|nr:MAG: hypothetical protein D6689_01645 [Deltaproteobacteria bacterium]